MGAEGVELYTSTRSTTRPPPPHGGNMKFVKGPQKLPAELKLFGVWTHPFTNPHPQHGSVP